MTCRYFTPTTTRPQRHQHRAQPHEGTKADKRRHLYSPAPRYAVRFRSKRCPTSSEPAASATPCLNDAGAERGNDRVGFEVPFMCMNSNSNERNNQRHIIRTKIWTMSATSKRACKPRDKVYSRNKQGSESMLAPPRVALTDQTVIKVRTPDGVRRRPTNITNDPFFRTHPCSPTTPTTARARRHAAAATRGLPLWTRQFRATEGNVLMLMHSCGFTAA
jgi:hypothetical protein